MIRESALTSRPTSFGQLVRRTRSATVRRRTVARSLSGPALAQERGCTTMTTVLDHRPVRIRLLRLGGAVVLAAAGTAAVATADAAASVPPTPAGWTQLFADDFNGSANSMVNTGNWLYDLGTSYPGGAANWGTGEVEPMTNSTAN